MSIFSEAILKLLNDYKRLLKRYVSTKEREDAIINIGIKRKSLKFDNDVILYNKAHRVLKEIEYLTSSLNRPATEYSGIKEFYEHLKNYLAQYRVDNNKIVHIHQQVSCALVQAIQIIAMPPAKLCENKLSLLDDCIQIIIKFGTEDQRVMLTKAFIGQQIEKYDMLELHTPSLDNLIKNLNFQPIDREISPA